MTIIPAMLLSGAAVALIRRFAPQLGLIDEPGERKVHVHAVPLGGGLGNSAVHRAKRVGLHVDERRFDQTARSQ